MDGLKSGDPVVIQIQRESNLALIAFDLP